MNRTTRRVSPTEIDLAYYNPAHHVLNDAGEADALVASMQSALSGLLRISVATDFGVNHCLLHCPSSLEDSSLRARKLTETTQRIIASPGYFEKYCRSEKNRQF